MVSTTFGNGQRITGAQVRVRAKTLMVENLRTHEQSLRIEMQGAGARAAAVAQPAAAAEDYLADLKGVLLPVFRLLGDSAAAGVRGSFSLGPLVSLWTGCL